jgi:2-C-methyl-D-erythritol 4-phosphate cytidylyltransferase
MEAVILAGGKAERLGEAAQGRPKSLVEIAGRPLAAYQVSALARAGVTRVIVSCAAGQEQLFEDELTGLGADVVAVGEPEALTPDAAAALARAQRVRLVAEGRGARAAADEQAAGVCGVVSRHWSSGRIGVPWKWSIEGGSQPWH